MKMISRTADPVLDEMRYQAQFDDEDYPVCSECGERIDDDFIYMEGDEAICEDCLNKRFISYEEYMDRYFGGAE